MNVFTKRNALRLVLAFAFWTLIGVLYSIQIALILDRSGTPVTIGFLVTGPLTFWYTWGFFSLGILRLVRRFPIEREHLLPHAAIHGIACFLLSFCHQIVYYVAHKITDSASISASLLSFLGSSFLSAIFTTNIVVYWMIVAGGHAADYYRRYRERERKAAELETLLARAQLNALKTQLHPHFLFNTLHTISALLDEDTAMARRMMSRLSMLLRWALDHGDDQEICLADELEMVSLYLDIEQVRFQDRLKVKIDTDGEVQDALVPAFLLQPIVENAIRHGIGNRSSPGGVLVGAKVSGDRLVLQVHDDGPDGVLDKHNGHGIGIANTRARLQQLYGSRQSFDITPDESGGTIVRITIPFHVLSGVPA